MELCNPNCTPTPQAALGSDPDGCPIKENLQYSSVVGMLLYLSTNTRIDCAFTVSQVCCFNDDPKQSHGSIVKLIIHYLAGTKNKGVIFTPKNDYCLMCFMDADFTGLHGYDVQDELESAQSKLGSSWIVFVHYATELSVQSMDSWIVLLVHYASELSPHQLESSTGPRYWKASFIVTTFCPSSPSFVITI